MSPRVKRILEVLFPEKRRRESSSFWKYCSQKKRPRLSRASAPELAQFYLFFFIFPGTVLPFCYFSVVRKVPEKPVLFLPHPNLGDFLPIGLLLEAHYDFLKG
jgi:hypothetical protein